MPCGEAVRVDAPGVSVTAEQCLLDTIILQQLPRGAEEAGEQSPGLGVKMVVEALPRRWQARGDELGRRSKIAGTAITVADHRRMWKAWSID